MKNQSWQQWEIGTKQKLKTLNENEVRLPTVREGNFKQGKSQRQNELYGVGIK